MHIRRRINEIVEHAMEINASVSDIAEQAAHIAQCNRNPQAAALFRSIAKRARDAQGNSRAIARLGEDLMKAIKEAEIDISV